VGKMSGYKADDPARQARSARYQQGLADGQQDAIRASMCPPQDELGPQNEPHSWMYARGYETGYQPSPCACNGACGRPR
jgi:hypothetical protein